MRIGAIAAAGGGNEGSAGGHGGSDVDDIAIGRGFGFGRPVDRNIHHTKGARGSRLDGQDAPGVCVVIGIVGQHLARAEIGRGYASIDRSDRKRTVNVTADVDPQRGDANQIVAALDREVLPALIAEHPGLGYSFEGRQRDQREYLSVLARVLVLSLLAIYVLLALPLRSYVQPLLIMLAVPFGLVGAVWGHVALGLDVTIFSLIGLMGLQGVVVNDSLVLIHILNKLRGEGIPLEQAIERACLMRFRPIIVTTATTCLGLTPLLFETATQALWIKPIAVSLAFGELFSTLIVLGLVPAAVLSLADLAALRRAPAEVRRLGPGPAATAPDRVGSGEARSSA